MHDRLLFLAVDSGGTKSDAVVADATGAVLSRGSHRRPGASGRSAEVILASIHAALVGLSGGGGCFDVFLTGVPQQVHAAAERMVGAVVQGRALFAFGATHSFIVVQEMVYRTGGLMLINPIYPHGMNFSVHPLPATSQMERVAGLGATLLDLSPAVSGDVLLIASTSGRNAVVIDMALRARDKGIKVIGMTALAYTKGVSSRHPSGKKLADLCDVVIDNGAPYGDAAVDVPGFAQNVAPLSTVTGCAIANALVTEVVEGLVARGLVPPVFMSANLDGGDAFNRRLLAENRERIHYL